MSVGDEWAGVGLSFYDENWNFLSEPDAAVVNTDSFRNYSVSSVAPQGARFAGAWLYTEFGVAIASCSLVNVSDAEPPAEPPVEPPVEPPANDELLVNSNFSGQLNGWEVCNASSGLSVDNNSVTVGAQNCVFQAVEVSAFQDLTLRCEVRRLDGGSKWSGVGISFYDQNWNFISEPAAAQIDSESFRTYTVAGTVPAGVGYAGVWVYTVSGVSINHCSLSHGGDVEPPIEPPVEPPQPPSENGSNFCPAYVDSPLYRYQPNTLVLGPEDDDWEVKIEEAPSGTEILLRDGEYLLDWGTIILSNPDVTVRSLSENRDAVVIRGMGFYTGASEGFMIAADRVTITEMTMYDIRRHAVAMKPELDYSDGNLYDTYVYNMDIYDIGTQHVKGSDGGPNINAVIACNTIGYNEGVPVGDYNGAIGMFSGIDVIIRDNTIYNITGDGTGCDVAQPELPCIYDSAPAIYARESRDTIVERNVVLESWRGISLGLVEGHIGGIVRNNFIYRSQPGDMGISIERSSDTIVEHNTVMVEGYWAPIEVKEGSGGHVFRNNQTNIPIQLRGTNNALLEGNVEYAAVDDFFAAGDFHLRNDSLAIGAGVPSGLTIDIEGDARSGRWDAGADQY